MANMDDVVKELRTGFGLLSKDIQLLIRSGGEAMRMGATSATKIHGTMREAMNIASESPRSFMQETFSKQFNRPALWSRDIVALSGVQPEYMDMTRREAEYYAAKHWGQRGQYLAATGAEIAAWSMGIVPGAIYSFGVRPLIDKYIGRKHDWWNFLDRSGKNNILAGQSSNRITYTGWDDSQLTELSRFMTTSHRGYGFKRDEADNIFKMADQQGYFKKTGDVETFKRSYRELLEGVKEIMQTMHTSYTEATQVMSDISSMQISNPAGYIKGLNVASAYSGLSAQQLTSWSKDTARRIYSTYGIPMSTGGELALNIVQDKDTSGLKSWGLNEIMSNPIYFAALSDYKDGELTLNEEVLNKFLTGQIGVGGLSERAAEYFRGGNIMDKYIALQTGMPGLLEQIGPNRSGEIMSSLALTKARMIVDQMYPDDSKERTNAMRFTLENMGLNQGQINASMKLYKGEYDKNLALELKKYRKGEKTVWEELDDVIFTPISNLIEDVTRPQNELFSILASDPSRAEQMYIELREKYGIEKPPKYLTYGGVGGHMPYASMLFAAIQSGEYEGLADEVMDRVGFGDKDFWRANKKTIMQLYKQGYVRDKGNWFSPWRTKKEVTRQAKILERFSEGMISGKYDDMGGILKSKDAEALLGAIGEARRKGEDVDVAMLFGKLGYLEQEDITDEDMATFLRSVHMYADIKGVHVDTSFIGLMGQSPGGLYGKWAGDLEYLSRRGSSRTRELLSTSEGQRLFTEIAVDLKTKSFPWDEIRADVHKEFIKLTDKSVSPGALDPLFDDVNSLLVSHHGSITGAQAFLDKKDLDQKDRMTEVSGIYKGQWGDVITLFNNLLIAAEQHKTATREILAEVRAWKG